MRPGSGGAKLSGTAIALALVVPVVVLVDHPAVAQTAPKTLADRRPIQAGPVEPEFPIDYVGVLWDEPAGHGPGGEQDAHEPHGDVRFRHQGRWGPWLPLVEDGAAAEAGPGHWASALAAGAGASAYQVRGVPAAAVTPEAVAINTTDGPRVRVGVARGGTAGAIPSSKCRSRADWGADESLRFNAGGTEVFPPAQYPVQVATVHHTATTNADPDPGATLRAIYRYHAVDNGWGDIGYHYLIDEAGVVHEGRWSGTRSASCRLEGGNGSDFAHEGPDLDGDGALDEMTTAAHVGGANSGNLGVALLGEFTDTPGVGSDPKAGAVTALEDLLAELGRRHSLQPTAQKTYVNPVPGDDDGDGDTDMALFSPSSGAWLVQGGITAAWGATGDIPVPGDYDGDGDTDMAVFRPATGTWFVRGGLTAAWGTTGDAPVAGDYDGDGDTDLAVFRPTAGVWFVLSGATVGWGTSGDVPLPLPDAIRRFAFPSL